MCGCLCVNICMGVRVAGRPESITFSEAGATYYYKLPNVFAETKLGSFSRSVWALNFWALSPVSVFRDLMSKS